MTATIWVIFLAGNGILAPMSGSPKFPHEADCAKYLEQMVAGALTAPPSFQYLCWPQPKPLPNAEWAR